MLCSGLYNDMRIYDAIRNEDMGQAVMITMNAMKEKNLFPPLQKQRKCETMSNQYRNQGNNAYKQANYQTALESYNKALLSAPKGTNAMSIAYANRSALLYTIKLYQACLKDIEMSIAFDCPSHIVEKLMKRKKLAESNIWKEKLVEEVRFSNRKGFPDFDFPRNPEIPCASTDIDIIMESGLPQVIAAKNIKVGTILAVEQAYVSVIQNEFTLTACHYCQKISPNLIPCDGCCFALFCNENCKRTCMAEYHSIECEVIDQIEMIATVKAAIKLKNSFKSWKEFIKSSQLLGLDRIEHSSIDEIFNGENKFSLLNYHQNKHFTHGLIFNESAEVAKVVWYLLEMGSFFPKKSENTICAMLCFSKVLMYMSLHVPTLEVPSSVSFVAENKTDLQITSAGVYPFIGKMPHSCNPNVLALGLNNRIVLLALKPLAHAEELSISYIGHHLDFMILSRQDRLLTSYGIICLCHLCRGVSWTTQKQPSEAQMLMYHKLNPKDAVRKIDIKHMSRIYNKAIEALTSLSDLPFSEEYKDVYTLYRKCLLDFQYAYCPNQMIDRNK